MGELVNLSGGGSSSSFSLTDCDSNESFDRGSFGIRGGPPVDDVFTLVDGGGVLRLIVIKRLRPTPHP